MNYEKLYKEAKKNDDVKQLDVEYIKFESEGSVVIGRLVAMNEAKPEKGDGTYIQYLMETSKGVKKFALGSATDKEIGTMLKIGSVYRIEYTGKEEIGKGWKVNRFKIEEINPPDEEEETEDTENVTEEAGNRWRRDRQETK